MKQNASSVAAPSPPGTHAAAGPSSPPPVRLSALPSGTRARLYGVHLAPSEHALLGALGLTEQSVLRVCKPGDPCIVEVRATRIGLSRTVADNVMVIPDERA